MKKSSLSLLLIVITMASVMNPMVPRVGAENSQFSNSFRLPVILRPSPPGSTVNAFAMITLDITKASTGTVTTATGSIVIIFSGLPGNASASRFDIREGLNGPPIKFGPNEFIIPIDSSEPFTEGCFDVLPDVAQRITNNPFGFYLDVVFGNPFLVIRGQLGSRPQIDNVQRRGKTLVVFGQNFRQGAEILMSPDVQVNFEVQETESDPLSLSNILISKDAGKKIAHGSTVLIQVRDPSGLTGDQVKFTRD